MPKTSWTVQMGINSGKPTFVFDQVKINGMNGVKQLIHLLNLKEPHQDLQHVLQG